jgi:hypothetical protein
VASKVPPAHCGPLTVRSPGSGSGVEDEDDSEPEGPPRRPALLSIDSPSNVARRAWSSSPSEAQMFVLDEPNLLPSPTPTRREFTRSRSPAPHTLNGHGTHPAPRSSSPARFLRKPSSSTLRFVLPSRISFSFRVAPSRVHISFSMDAKYAIETVLLLGALLTAAYKLSLYTSMFPLDLWLSIGTSALLLFAHRAH